ncbi:HD-GYP domain-containing protein [Azospira restricta]|uniref:HD domain-containing protein n=1 Tax=Azospira restricta TaxID=404405 RepID=A0A974PVM7_9RHOO|nr:HD domain-containing phosphohydrolase [Azospira restricta]QRJ62280.1 HD domain-containing protein [Azospira restricta]
MKQRITLQDLKVGQPLPWDAYGADGVLLLRKGQSVQSQMALERLIDEGLFLQRDDSSARPLDPAAAAEKPTAMQHLVDARRSLGHICAHSPEQTLDFAGRMTKLIDSVQAACDLHPALAMSSILLMHDTGYTVKHAIDTAILACLLGRELALDAAAQRATIGAALTMNIGMFEVQDKVDAITGALNDKLLAMIRQHPAHGAERLKRLGVADAAWLACVRQHHENSDGSGYPDGLAGDAIAIGARIIGIADRYGAMVSSRAYHGPHKPNQALRDLYLKQGQQIDVTVAATLIRIVGIYPVGTLVRLKTAEIGVVTGPGESPDTPAVHAVIAKSGLFLEVASYRKTHLPDSAIDEVITFDKLTTPVRMAHVWGKDARFR